MKKEKKKKKKKAVLVFMLYILLGSLVLTLLKEPAVLKKGQGGEGTGIFSGSY